MNATDKLSILIRYPGAKGTFFHSSDGLMNVRLEIDELAVTSQSRDLEEAFDHAAEALIRICIESRLRKS